MPPSSPPPTRGRPPSWTDDDRALPGGADDSGFHSIVLEEGSLLAHKYRLARPAGFGGMAQLWVATNQATGAEVCIKILVPENSDDESVERFRREAYAAARLSHRAIVRIFDLVELGTNGEATTSKPAALAIVMELLHGETLGDFLLKRGKLPLEESIDLVLPFLSALAHAHRAGVVHRDLKPDNIFLSTDPDGHVIPKVLDFGVSKVANVGDGGLRPGGAPLTLDGVMLGTPAFMSPEQARGARDVDSRSDVFSSGILFYMMLTGKNPFESESFHSVIGAVLQREVPRPPGLPDAIWEVLDKSLAKDPTARYADATELGIALRRASGRASTTDSGPHSAAALPASVRKISAPLGGDSHVSVPPVGNAELGDTSGDPMPSRAARPAARRRAVRIVLAVLAASVVLTAVAFLRSPSGSTAATGGKTTGDVPSVTAKSTAAAPATATATAASETTATATATQAPPDAGAALPRHTDNGGAGARGPSATTAAPSTTLRKKDPPRGPAGAPLSAPSSGGLKEPSIVRDPGF